MCRNTKYMYMYVPVVLVINSPVTVPSQFCRLLYVCVSVKLHLTSGASVCPENTVMYSVCNGGQKNCGFFFETAPLQRSSTPSVVQSAIFPQKACMSIIVHVVFTTWQWTEAVISSCVVVQRK